MRRFRLQSTGPVQPVLLTKMSVLLVSHLGSCCSARWNKTSLQNLNLVALDLKREFIWETKKSFPSYFPLVLFFHLDYSVWAAAFFFFLYWLWRNLPSFKCNGTQWLLGNDAQSIKKHILIIYLFLCFELHKPSVHPLCLREGRHLDGKWLQKLASHTEII